MMEDAKQEFLDIFYEFVEREGAEKLLDYLERSDFFVAPASTRSHSAYKGGLIEHNLKVYRRFIKLLTAEYGDYTKVIPDESVAIIALLHDVCKINFYKEDFRNVKENGIWVQKPYYAIEDSLPYGHGEKSVYILSGFMKLTREEAMAINWHMGAFDARAQHSYTLSEAFTRHPISLLFHIADMTATYLDEKRIENY